METETATHSSILARWIPWTEEPDGLQSIGSQKSRTQLKQLSMHAHRETKVDELSVKRNGYSEGWQLVSMEFPFELMKSPNIDCGDSCTSLNILKPLNCILWVCELYLNKTVTKKNWDMNIALEHFTLFLKHGLKLHLAKLFIRHPSFHRMDVHNRLLQVPAPIKGESSVFALSLPSIPRLYSGFIRHTQWIPGSPYCSGWKIEQCIFVALESLLFLTPATWYRTPWGRRWEMLMGLKILLRRKLTKTYIFSLKINVIRSCEFLQRFSGKKRHQKESKEQGRRLKQRLV